MICGEYVSHTPGDWLELHEIYEYDVPKRIQKITGVVSICHDCHMYIHCAFLDTQVQEGKVSESERERIMERGSRLLAKNGLKKKHWTQNELRDPHWKLEFQGKLYSRDIDGNIVVFDE